MNLACTIEVFAGGPGSGCNPQKGRCGRVAESYHGTSPEAAEKIKVQGIRPGYDKWANATSSRDSALSYAVGTVLKNKFKIPSGLYKTISPGEKVALVVLKPAQILHPRLADAEGSKNRIPASRISRIELYNLNDFGYVDSTGRWQWKHPYPDKPVEIR